MVNHNPLSSAQNARRKGFDSTGLVDREFFGRSHIGSTYLHDVLVDAQIRLNESQAHTDKNLARTDENLRNLIAILDRYCSEGRNGK